jgi:hypothetical protein
LRGLSSLKELRCHRVVERNALKDPVHYISSLSQDGRLGRTLIC